MAMVIGEGIAFPHHSLAPAGGAAINAGKLRPLAGLVIVVENEVLAGGQEWRYLYETIGITGTEAAAGLTRAGRAPHGRNANAAMVPDHHAEAKVERRMTEEHAGWTAPLHTGFLVLADGTVLEGFGLGAEGHAVGEVCFNTAMTGYEEILTDPSYAGQLITFTFPHIGNVGTNDEDIETVNMAATPGARGVILRAAISDPSNHRATRHFDEWLKARGIVGLCGIDTRALTALIRNKGMPNAVIAHASSGVFDLHGLKEEAREWPGLEGMDLVPMVTSGQRFTWDETPWSWEKGFGRQSAPKFNVVAIDYGIKRNILRL